MSLFSVSFSTSPDFHYPVDECCLWLHPSNIWWPSLLKLVRQHSLRESAAFSANKRETDTVVLLVDMGCCVFSPACFKNNIFLSSRREMMPILSLIFSALFILFGTVIIQAFRWERHDPFSFCNIWIICPNMWLEITLSLERPTGKIYLPCTFYCTS